MRIQAAILAAALALPAALPAGAQEVPSAAEASLAEAAANRARVKTAPAFVDGPKAVLPESEKALGRHGTVLVEGVIGADGRMRQARVKSSSGAPTLDAIALAAAQATRFTPAQDAQGAALPVLASMPFELVAYKSATGGMFDYRCEQFVRDMDWWRATFPEKPWKEHELYRLEAGLALVSVLDAALRDQAKLKKAVDGFDSKWAAAIDKCRRKPAMLQKDAIFR